MADSSTGVLGVPSARLLVHDVEGKSYLREVLDLLIAWEGLRRPWWVLWSCTMGTRRSRVTFDITTLDAGQDPQASASAWYGSPCATVKLMKAIPSASRSSRKCLLVSLGPCLEGVLKAIPPGGLLDLLHAELLIRLQGEATV